MPSKSNHRKTVVYVVALAALVLLSSIPAFQRVTARVAADFYHPFLQAPLKIENELSDKSLLLENKTTLAAALLRLRRENELLAARLAVSKALARENAELRVMANLSPRAAHSFLFAEIIRRDPMNWNAAFHIDKGAEAGVKPGAAVLARGEPGLELDQPAVIGRVVAVSDKEAEVRTIIDPQCRISVVLAKTGAPGVLSGGGPSGNQFLSRLTYLPKNAEWSPGEKVNTSEFSDMVPGGLRVGTLTRKTSTGDRDELYQTLDVLVAGRFRDARVVMVTTEDDE